MPRDDTSSKQTMSRGGASTWSSGADKSDADDTHRITSEACVFPEQTFVSKTNSTAESQAKTEGDEQATIVEKDGPWAWITCCCAIMNQLIIFGTLNVYTIFLVKFVSEFEVSTASAAWLGSMTFGLMKLFGPLASTVSMHAGNKYAMIVGAVLCAGALLTSSFALTFNVLFGTFCIPYALGAALTITPAAVVPLEYFNKYQSTTMGLVQAASSVGTLLLAPLIRVLLDEVDWRRTFQIHSGIHSTLIFVNMLIRPRKIKPLSYIKKPMLRSLIADLALWKNRVFLLWVVAIAVVYIGYSVPNILLASYCKYIGGTNEEAAYVIMVMGFATTFSRLTTARLLRCDLLSRLHFKQIIFVVMGTSYLMLAHIHNLEGLYAFAAVRGLLDGAHIVMLPMLTASMVGASKAILGWGYLAGAISVTYTLGPPAAGALVDLTGKYDYSFIMAGLPLITAGLLLFLLPWAQRTGRAVNVLRDLGEIDQHPDVVNLKDRLNVYLGRNSPLGSIQEFIRQEALISEIGSSLATRRNSYNDISKRTRAQSDTTFVLRPQNVKPLHSGPQLSRSDPVLILHRAHLHQNFDDSFKNTDSMVTAKSFSNEPARRNRDEKSDDQTPSPHWKSL